MVILPQSKRISLKYLGQWVSKMDLSRPNYQIWTIQRH